MSNQEPFANFIKVWETSVSNQVNKIIGNHKDLTQLELRSKVNEELHNLMTEYPGQYTLQVNPKGDDEIQVILVIAEFNSNPEFKIKPRFKVPSLNNGAI
jgi:hypothetical protein